MAQPANIVRAENPGINGRETAMINGGAPTRTGETGCTFWLPKKRRFCTNRAKPGHSFCGNHLPDAALVKKRVSCPADPSHTVPEDEVAAHVLRCPAAKQAQEVRDQPYFRKGVNAGDDPGESSGGVLSSREKRALLERLSDQEFWEFLDKIERAYAAVCPEPLPKRVSLPESFRSWIDGGRDSQSPFSMKHWEQQASILGNMHRVGLIDPRPLPQSHDERTPGGRVGPKVVPLEMAAIRGNGGGGHLGSIHTGASGMEEKQRIPRLAALSESKPTGWNSDALKPDSEALDASASTWGGAADAQNTPLEAGVPGERASSEDAATSSGRVFIEFGAGRGYLANALYECFGQADVLFVERRSYKFKADRALRKAGKMERIRIDIEDLSLAGVRGLAGRGFGGAGKHLCGPATDATLRCCFESEERGSDAKVDGVGQRFEDRRKAEVSQTAKATIKVSQTSNRGALGGEEALHLGRELVARSRESEAPLCVGVAVATCCHHLCSWKAYVNKAFFRRLGFGPSDFHMLTWLTSWCVSGPKFGDHRGGGAADDDVSNGAKSKKLEEGAGSRDDVVGGSANGEGHEVGPHSGVEAQGSEADKMNGLQNAPLLADGLQPGSNKTSGGDDLTLSKQAHGSVGKGTESRSVQIPIWDALPAAHRVELGRKCKRLIDTGRLEWLVGQEGFAGELVEYVDDTISPENRLLLGSRRGILV